MAKKKEVTAAQKVEIAVGITAAAVAAAGAYFLYGSKNAEKNRKKVKGWMLKAKGEVLDALDEAQHMTQEEYEQLIEGVTTTYASVKGATKGDLSAFKKEMKEYWEQIEKQGKKVAAKAMKKAATTAKKTAKKTAVKKTAKKAAKKAPTKKAAKKTAKKSAKKTTKKA